MATMTYEEFEWHILRLVYEEGMTHLQASYLAYALGLSHDTVTDYLDQATTAGLLELDVDLEGRLEYTVPGLDEGRQLPRPIWKEDEPPATADPGDDAGISPPQPTGAAPPSDAAPPPDARPSPRSDAAADGDPGAPSTHLIPRPSPAADHRLAVARHPLLPSALREHIEARYGTPADTSLVRLADQSPIVGIDARVDDPTSRAMVALGNDEHFPFRVEACDDTYCDPTQTVFMRQIRVHGVNSEAELRRHVQRLFESCGYRIVQAEEDRLRFERGSVTFILALVPLFVLVLPLFVYLFLYCMGRSTIHQEPVELDVQFRQLVVDDEPVYEIDLTFIGLHGVVLGAADQRVLNQEIDTLRDELRWSLSPG